MATLLSPGPEMRAHLERRTRQAGSLEAYRILHGEIDGAPPKWNADRFGSSLVIRAPDEGSVNAHGSFLEGLLAVKDWDGVALKLRDGHRHRSLRPGLDEHVVQEGPARLRVRTDDGYQVGLFIEGRALRNEISRRSRGGQVLSLFSYTGSASIRAALKEGRITSVDASKRAHQWARENFRLSGLDPDDHRWFADDASSFLRRCPEDAWDELILDPPAFGRAGRKIFKLERDLDELARESLRVARRIYFSTHDPKTSDDELIQVWRRAGRSHGQRVRLDKIPNDFDLPEGGSDWGRFHRAFVIERA